MENPCKTTPLKELNDQSVTECITQTLLHSNQQKIEKHSHSSNDDDNKILKSSNCINSMGSSLGLGLGSPDRLKVPKPFKYPERYTSPTDHMMSPISKGLLARSRRGSALLPPSKIQSKIHELRSPEAEKIQMKMDQ